MKDLISLRSLMQFLAYGAVGALNTALNFLFINFAIYITGASSGPLFLMSAFIIFFLLVIHSFVWNRTLIFKRENPHELHREYAAFFAVTGFTSLVNLGILHIMVDIIGAPQGISPHLWANLAIAVTIPISVTLNFLGYKFLVFREKPVV